MLKDLAEPRRVVTLIPNTGIQFLDFGFNEAGIQNVARNFWEEVSRSEVDEDGKP